MDSAQEKKLAALMQSIDFMEMMKRYIDLQRRGDRYWALCPFHDEKAPSFSCAPGKNIWYCFECNKGGNLLTFIKEINDCDDVQAIQILEEHAREQEKKKNG